VSTFACFQRTFADIDAMYDQDEQVEAALMQPKKKRGKISKAEREAEEAAAAAAAEAAAAAAAEAAAASPGSSSSEDEGSEAGLDSAAAAAADEAEGDEDEDEIDFGVLSDPAPYVILRLRDNAETRAVWPHKFELYYKVCVPAAAVCVFFALYAIVYSFSNKAYLALMAKCSHYCACQP
jgi:hypothetical protein